MVDWYVSSTAYALIPAFQATHAYTVGNIIGSGGYVSRCTTAGTSGTTFNPIGAQLANNATTVTGSVTFTQVSGQSAYGWAAAASTCLILDGNGFGGQRFTVGDRCFFSSDHVETATINRNFPTTAVGTPTIPLQYISVNKAGSIPPVSSDLLAGASIAITSGVTFTFNGSNYFNGLTFTTSSGFLFNGTLTSYGPKFDNCALLVFSNFSGNGLGSTFRASNTAFKFNSAASTIGNVSSPIIDWRNTATGISGATIPTQIFTTDAGMLITIRGVGLSALTTTLTSALGTGKPNQILLDSCTIASGLTRLGGTNTFHGAVVELVNCYDGTNMLSERWVAAGSVATERTIVLTNGSQDDQAAFSHKMVTGTVVDKYVQQLEGFPLHTFNSIVGFTKTATVEIISSTTLNTDEISLIIEYPGTSGSPIKSFVTNLCDVVSTPVAVTSSSSAWSSSPSTPVGQKLQVSFTPQRTGWIRGIVCLGKASTTVYHNAMMTIL